MNKVKIKKVTKTGGIVGKRIFVEGSKVVITGAFLVVMETLISKGIRGVRSLSMNELLEIEETEEEEETALDIRK